MGGSASPVRAVPAGGPGGEMAAPGVSGQVPAPVRQPVRRAPVRRGTRPLPAGPGRLSSRPGGALGRRSSAARPVAVRPGRARPVARRRASVAPAPAGWRMVAGTVLLALVAAVAVAGLGLLADAVRGERVPEPTGAVRVQGDESLWQVARRAAPSADPGAAAARIVELNDLDSPSVKSGQVLVTPLG